MDFTTSVIRIFSGSSSLLELWHNHIGHPSGKVVKLLPRIKRLKGCLNKGCEICFRARHLIIDRFPSSDNG